MSDKDEILAALSALRTESVEREVKLQRTVDRIANDQVAARQDISEVKGEVLALGGRVSKLETARTFSDRVRANLSDTDAKHESDLAAVVTELEAMKKQQFALMAVNQKQTGLLDLLRGSLLQRLIKETTRLVILIAAVVSAYLSAKGHK